jgi:hypothetical protein
MTLTSMTSLGMMWQDDGLTFREILGNLPSDPASLVVLAIVAVVVGLVLWGNRKKGGRST